MGNERTMEPIRTDVRKVQVCLEVKFVKGWKIDITSMRFIHHLLQDADEIVGVYGIRKENAHQNQ